MTTRDLDFRSTTRIFKILTLFALLKSYGWKYCSLIYYKRKILFVCWNSTAHKTSAQGHYRHVLFIYVQCLGPGRLGLRFLFQNKFNFMLKKIRKNQNWYLNHEENQSFQKFRQNLIDKLEHAYRLCSTALFCNSNSIVTCQSGCSSHSSNCCKKMLPPKIFRSHKKNLEHPKSIVFHKII